MWGLLIAGFAATLFGMTGGFAGCQEPDRAGPERRPAEAPKEPRAGIAVAAPEWLEPVPTRPGLTFHGIGIAAFPSTELRSRARQQALRLAVDQVLGVVNETLWAALRAPELGLNETTAMRLYRRFLARIQRRLAVSGREHVWYNHSEGTYLTAVEAVIAFETVLTATWDTVEQAGVPLERSDWTRTVARLQLRTVPDSPSYDATVPAPLRQQP